MRGSTATTRTVGIFSLSTSPTPVSVPPVPTPRRRRRGGRDRLEDLERVVAPVRLGVGRVLELLRHEIVRMLPEQLAGGVDGAGHPLDRRVRWSSRRTAPGGAGASTLMSSGIVRISR